MKLKARYKILIGLLLVVVILITGVTFYFESIASKVIVSELGKRGLDAKFGDLSLSLLQGKCSIADLDLKTNTGEQLLQMANLSVNTDFWKAVSGEVVLQEVAMNGLQASGQLDEAGKLNWLTIADQIAKTEAKPKAETESKGSFDLQSIRIDDLKVQVIDHRKGSPVGSLDLDVAKLNANLKRGEINIGNLEFKTAAPSPRLKVNSVEAKGEFALASGKIPSVKSIEVSGWDSSNRLNEKGNLDLVEWLTDIARMNGLLAEEPESEKQTDAKTSFELPESISLNNVHVALAYPGQDGKDLSEALQLDRMSFDNKKETIELGGISLKHDGSGQPIVSLGKASVTASLLTEPLNVKKVNLEDLALNLDKDVKGSFTSLQRIERITSLLPESEAKDKSKSAAPVVSGPIDVQNAKVQVRVTEGSKTLSDNIVQIASAHVGFNDGRVALGQIMLSDSAGNLKSPTLSIKSIESKGNLTYPLPDAWKLDYVTVDTPVVRLKKSPETGIDLLRRLDQITGEEDTTAQQSDETALNLTIGKLDVKNLDMNLTDQLPSGSSVEYRMTPGSIVMEQLHYSNQGMGSKSMVAKAALVSPSTGSINVDMQLPRQKKIDNFSGKYALYLSDVTGLSPYYADKLPFELVGGGFSLGVEGACKNRQLDFPYDVSLLSPQMKSKRQGFNIPVLKQLTQNQAMPLLNSLKNNEGNIRYKGRLTGSLDEPQFINIWQGVGQGLSSQLVQNVKNLPGLPGEVLKETGKQIQNSAGQVGDLLKNLPGLLVPTPKKETQK